MPTILFTNHFFDVVFLTSFFLMYLPIAGHHPYHSPFEGPFFEGGEKGRYLNALSYADKALERLVEGLKDRGLLEQSLLVIFDLESRHSYRFDLRADPLERWNLSDGNALQMTIYQKHLIGWSASQKALLSGNLRDVPNGTYQRNAATGRLE